MESLLVDESHCTTPNRFVGKSQLTNIQREPGSRDKAYVKEISNSIYNTIIAPAEVSYIPTQISKSAEISKQTQPPTATMKLIASRLVQQERDIERLELELEQAHAEIARLRTDNAAVSSGTRLSRRLDSTYGSEYSSSRASSSIRRTPSYSKPTTAFLNRTRAASEASLPQKHLHAYATDQSIVYVDGRIVEKETVENTGYLKHTESSAAKTGKDTEALQEGVTFSTKRRENNADFEPEQEEPLDWLNCTERYNDQPKPFDIDDAKLTLDENNDPIEILENETRLRDTDFYATQPGNARVPFDVQIRSLKKAHAIAQDSLFNATRQRWPEAWRAYYINGPRTVRFGLTEIESTIGNWGGRRSNDGLPTTPPKDIVGAIERVTYLRNAIAHPSVHSTSGIDGLMQDAQRLACALEDESRARRIRRLRDDLQKVAEKSFEEIVAYELLSYLPERRPWALHHQSFFLSIISDKHIGEDRLIETYGAAAVRAAMFWDLRCEKPGQDGAQYLASVERQKAAYFAAEAKWKAEIEAAGRLEDVIAQDELNVKADSPTDPSMILSTEASEQTHGDDGW